MVLHGSAPGRAAARAGGLPAGQVVEAFVSRRRYRHVLAWGERFGLPLALLAKLARSPLDVVLIAVWLSRPKKAVFLRHLKVQSNIRLIVTRAAQAEVAVERLGVPPDRLRVEPRPVDDAFWQAPREPPRRRVCSVGLEARDYRTLLDAVRDTDIDTELAVGSIALPEDRARRAAARGGVLAATPPNVRLGCRGPLELRELYASSQAVVIPLHAVDFDAGVTAATEGMAMSRPIVATRTRGLADLFTDGVEGFYVRPGDPRALRGAIRHLLDHPEQAARMGAAGRALVERRHRLDDRLDVLANLVLDGVRGTSA